ncbi:hypothetical protein [Actinomadura fibrosa]|uniref:Uncharacterized protein n=1 Tax=Actinomadura fibrosa TaxID=111802 RepID=A0ABW2XJR4_9ACTN|nr:hypothetical protein [Actinomadura fibrosa]
MLDESESETLVAVLEALAAQNGDDELRAAAAGMAVLLRRRMVQARAARTAGVEDVSAAIARRVYAMLRTSEHWDGPRARESGSAAGHDTGPPLGPKDVDQGDADRERRVANATRDRVSENIWKLVGAYHRARVRYDRVHEDTRRALQKSQRMRQASLDILGRPPDPDPDSDPDG